MFKRLAFLVFAFVLGREGYAQQSTVPDSQLNGVRIKSVRLDDTLLGWILTSGRRVDLKQVPNAPRGVEAAIWEAPFESTCVEGMHLVCGHRYLLIASGDGEGLGPYTFDLGYLGVLTPREWDPADTTEYWKATLRVHVVNYPDNILRSSRKVVRVERQYALSINAIAGTLAVKEIR